MAIASPIQSTCPSCGAPVETILHKSYVIEDDASLRAILEHRFHLIECPKCGETRPFEADFLVTNKPRDLFVQVIAKDEEVPSMIEAMRSMLGGQKVHARIVPSRAALVEKVKLWSLGTDDVAIEVLKHFLRIQLHDLEGKTTRYFERDLGGDLLFSIWTPGQPVKGMQLPKQVYLNVQRELDTPRHAAELEVDERLARRLLDEKRAAKKA